MKDVTTDLNQTISSAVTARIEAEVFAALAGDEVMAQYVAKALQQPVEVQNHRTYRKEEIPYLRHVLVKAIQEATKAAVGRVIEEERPLIEEEVRKAVKRSATTIASGIAESLAERASQGYGINIDLKVPGDGL